MSDSHKRERKGRVQLIKIIIIFHNNAKDNEPSVSTCHKHSRHYSHVRFMELVNILGSS